MISNNLYSIFDLKSDEQIVTFYMGMFSKEGTEDLLSNVRSIVEAQRDPLKVKTKVFKIAVELIQNVVKHCSNKDFEANVKNYFLIVRSQHAYKIKTGNCIQLEETETISSKIEGINQMEKTVLKQNYLNTLSNISSAMINSGAGIGLMEVALCSSNPIDYWVTPIDEHTNFLVINSTYNIT